MTRQLAAAAAGTIGGATGSSRAAAPAGRRADALRLSTLVRPPGDPSSERAVRFRRSPPHGRGDHNQTPSTQELTVRENGAGPIPPTSAPPSTRCVTFSVPTSVQFLHAR